jgi:2-polyprenyl-3-methyl-5-hydroxy-6-metoxy-1,4-benzoquinol methylase
MPMTPSRPCLLCASPSQPCARIERGEVVVLRCQACGHYFTSRVREADDVESAGANSTETTQDYTQSLIDSRAVLGDEFLRQARLRSEVMRRSLGKDQLSILEIGCGAGGLGQGYVALGHRYVGLDIDSRVIALAQGAGLDARHLDFMDFQSPDTFDVICFSQVLEHALRPRAFLEKVKTHLARPGFIHVDVPNHDTLAGLPSRIAGGLGARYGAINYPEHCSSFTSRSLQAVLSAVFEGRVRVFKATPVDESWGQVRRKSVAHRTFYAASRLLGRESILAATVEVPSLPGGSSR